MTPGRTEKGADDLGALRENHAEKRPASGG